MDYKTGKLPRKSDYRTLRFKKYAAGLIPPLDEFSVLLAVSAKLGITVSQLIAMLPMDHNDKYGLCVEAGAAHQATCWNGMVGKSAVLDADALLDDYLKRTGGEDSGLNMLDFLKDVRTNGLLTEKPIHAFAAIMDPTDLTLCRQGISLFGGLYVGIQCWDDVVKQFEAGLWTGGPLDNDGHCIYIPAYDQRYFYCSTWGGLVPMTLDCWKEVVDEVYVIIPEEAVDDIADFAPGFDIAGFEADLAAIGNENI